MKTFQTMPAPVATLAQSDAGQIEQFATALFRYARPETWVSLRAFPEANDGPPSLIEPVQADLPRVIERAAALAQQCAIAPRPEVFCPPVCTFHTHENAKAVNVAQGLALSVDSDANNPAARERLESLLGPATLAVASGGVWTCPDTGAAQDKLHLHWRLAQPTETPEDHGRLKHARELATRLVSGDASGVPLVHPMRWPGSVHRKATPRLARIIAATDAEISLDDALARLAEATGQSTEPPALTQPVDTMPCGPERLDNVRALLGYITPPPGRPDWRPLVAAIHEATSGGQEGRAMAHEWSARDPANYDARALDKQWHSYTCGKANNNTIGTLRVAARDAGAPPTVTQPPLAEVFPNLPDYVPQGMSLTPLPAPTAQAAPVAAPARASRFFPATDFAGETAPPRPWHVPDIIPGDTVTLLGGDGGSGKSLVALQLAVSTALGRPWMGQDVRAGRCIYISAEDDRDEIHRRLRGICAAGFTSLAALDGLTLRSLAGEDALLAHLFPAGVLAPSPLLNELDATMASVAPSLLVLDTLADLFPGDENNRAQARQFVGLLRGLAIRHSCAVLLLAHPSKSGMGHGGDGTSGSTAWNNSVRSRLYLDRIREDGHEPNPDARRLSVAKANYGRTGLEIGLQWRAGVFEPLPGETSLDRMATGAKAESVFLKLLREYTAQGRRVNHVGAATYAPKEFAAHPGCEGITKRAFKTAMEGLLASGKIEIVRTGPASRSVSYIVETENSEI